MSWLTWRQFRIQALVAGIVLAALAIIYCYTGPHLRHLYNSSGLTGCGRHSDCQSLAVTFMNNVKADGVYPALFFAGALILIVLPAIMGAFWGAPLVTRELETGTYRLAWNQDVTRTRWMAIKLGIVGLGAAALAGLFSLIFTWWAGPIDYAGGFPNNFGYFTRLSPLMFVARGLAPVGYALLAFAVGVIIGVMIRRTVPAMAITIAIVVAFQFLWPTFVRPHLLTPDRASAPVTLLGLNDMIVSHTGVVTVPINQPGTPQLSGAWVVSNTSLTPSGHAFVLPQTSICAAGSITQCDAWIAGHHLTQVVRYLPASDFWPLQWYETSVLLILAVGVGGAATWRVRRLLT